LLHGKFTSFYPDGRVKETGNYRSGLREGLWEEHSDKESIKAVGTYYHGQKKGDWRYYTTGGKLLEMREYDNGGVETMQHQFRSK
jgi:antitoxin component YwqK of YwqJK toxin-antitoxin module